VVCILLLQSEYGGPTTISCEVTQTILSLRDNTVCSRHTLQTVQRTQCAMLEHFVMLFYKLYFLAGSMIKAGLAR